MTLLLEDMWGGDWNSSHKL